MLPRSDLISKRCAINMWVWVGCMEDFLCTWNWWCQWTRIKPVMPSLVWLWTNSGLSLHVNCIGLCRFCKYWVFGLLTHLPLVSQCCFIVSWALRNQLQWNFNQNTKYECDLKEKNRCFYTSDQQSWRGYILDSHCPLLWSSVFQSVCGQHGFCSKTTVCFGIAISIFTFTMPLLGSLLSLES